MLEQLLADLVMKDFNDIVRFVSCIINNMKNHFLFMLVMLSLLNLWARSSLITGVLVVLQFIVVCTFVHVEERHT